MCTEIFTRDRGDVIASTVYVWIRAIEVPANCVVHVLLHTTDCVNSLYSLYGSVHLPKGHVLLRWRTLAVCRVCSVTVGVVRGYIYIYIYIFSAAASMIYVSLD